MHITIVEIDNSEEEELILRCHEASAEMLEIARRFKTAQTKLVGYQDREIHRLSLDELYYFEVLENRAFFYCRNNVYESKMKLYEFEEATKGTSFFRASRSMLLNADKIDFIAPSFSGRFEVTLLNKEKVIVSRQYVSLLKKKMGL